MDDLGTILGVWAHPDDEAYLSGGIMAGAIRAGRHVACVTATRGEAADPERWPPDELAKIREAELEACLAILGVTDHRWLDYPDFGCAAVDVDEAADRVAAIIDEVRPDTVLTFGPDGMTGHPDHQAVSHWTKFAVERAASTPQLLFATKTLEWAAMFEEVGREVGVMMGAEEMPRTAREDLAIDVCLEGALLDIKEQAMLAQMSQTADMVAALGRDGYREVLREESFRHP